MQFIITYNSITINAKPYTTNIAQQTCDYQQHDFATTFIYNANMLTVSIIFQNH